MRERTWGDCMLRIAVCDDEPSFVKQISGIIKQHIHFPDIQMGKMNGIETAKKLREADGESIIIFITGAREYVFDAFDVAALHYLVKPVDDKKLYEALCRAEKQTEKRKNREDRQIFIKTRKKNNYFEYFGYSLL